jgi:hypothetical protein
VAIDELLSDGLSQWQKLRNVRLGSVRLVRLAVMHREVCQARTGIDLSLEIPARRTVMTPVKTIFPREPKINTLADAAQRMMVNANRPRRTSNPRTNRSKQLVSVS